MATSALRTCRRNRCEHSRQPVSTVSRALSHETGGYIKITPHGWAWAPRDGEYTVTLSGGDTVPAQFVGRDPTTDVALLRVDRSDLQPVPLEAAPVRVGALVIAIGADDGAPTAALGIAARSQGAWRSLRGGEIDARIELDLHLRRSARRWSGLRGRRPSGWHGGVWTPPARACHTLGHYCACRSTAGDSRTHPARLSRAWPSARVNRGWQIGRHGDERRPSKTRSIHQGDIVISRNGEPIRHVQSTLHAIGPDRVGQTVTIGLRRAGRAHHSR
jgi:hypothetical protein